MTVGEVDRILLEAADLLETVGWCQGSVAVDAEGEEVDVSDDRARAYCASGALRRALLDVEGVLDGEYLAISNPVWRRLMGFLPRTADNTIPSLPAWNDDPERTAEEVISTMRRAAA